MRAIDVAASYLIDGEVSCSDEACLVVGDTGFCSFVDHTYNVLVPTDIPVDNVPDKGVVYLLRGVLDKNGNTELWTRRTDLPKSAPLLALGSKAE